MLEAGRKGKGAGDRGRERSGEARGAIELIKTTPGGTTRARSRAGQVTSSGLAGEEAGTRGLPGSEPTLAAGHALSGP